MKGSKGKEERKGGNLYNFKKEYKACVVAAYECSIEQQCYSD